MNQVLTKIQFLPILLALIAGLSNGAYLFPLKKDNANSLVWILFAIFTFLILPIIILSVVILKGDFSLPHEYIIYILLTGLVYGTGMFFLTKSVQYIGLGIPFGLSIATGTISGSLFSVFISGHFNTFINLKTILSYFAFVISISLYSVALCIRDKGHNTMWFHGLVLCIFSSILCASQGACLSVFADYFKAHNQGFDAQLIPWSLIFISCSPIFIFSHFLDFRKSKSAYHINWSTTVRTAILMFVLYSISIIIYTIAITKTAIYSEEYLWIIFMAGIILASTLCSYLKKEWQTAKLKANLFNFAAIIFLLVSIVFVTISI